MSRYDEVRCVCGHAHEPHEHYRPGTECSWCPPGGCPRFRPAEPLGGRLLRLAASVARSRRSRR